MSESIAIRTDNLGKTFGRSSRTVQAVKDLNLEVQAGQVYGFLGPNGAGKTTTIRMLLDLIRPSQGEVRLYDQPVTRQHRVLGRVGAIVERATFYDYLSGQKNLEVLARTGGFYDAQRIRALLEQVGLADQARRRVGGYSTGMKQRLGLAAALLHDPDLLILDEPTGGLDPAGIQEIRRLLRDLADRQGKTVFLSSHLLGEVEQVCDRVAIIHQGKLVGEGDVTGLLAGRSQLHVEASPLDGAAEVLSKTWPISYDGQRLLVEAQHREVPQIVRRLVADGVDVYQVTRQRQTLETFFLRVTQEENQDAVGCQ
jgi:ABC-2 type transport system ATP-binding protein